MADRYLNARETAAAFGGVISARRLLDLARRNLIPHTRLGRSVRFPLEAVSIWLRAGGTGWPN